MSRTAEIYLQIGRELFPTSDCLKAAQREHMIYREIISHNADICCLQEWCILPCRSPIRS